MICDMQILFVIIENEIMYLQTCITSWKLQGYKIEINMFLQLYIFSNVKNRLDAGGISCFSRLSRLAGCSVC